MKPRTIILLLSLLAAGLGVALWQARLTHAGLTAQVARLSRQNAGLRYEARQAGRQAEDFSRKAIELDSQLGSAKTRTTATESRHHLLARELSEREQREVALMTELATLRQKLAEAALPPGTSASPAGARTAPPAGRPVEPAPDVSAYRSRITGLEEQLVRLLTRALAEPPAPREDERVPAPTPPAPFQVVRVGPRDAFVVIDYGSGQGARPDQILSLWRGTSEVARVQISDARPRFSLAQVLPSTLKGLLQPGDLVVLTN